MARIPMVTRTIVSTKVIVMCLDVQAGEPCNKEVTVARTYKDDEALLNKVRPLIETETLKAVHIVDKEEIETLYGMTEQDFIQYAKVLPPRNGTNSDEEAEATPNRNGTNSDEEAEAAPNRNGTNSDEEAEAAPNRKKRNSTKKKEA